MRVAIDTNVLAYAEGTDDTGKMERAMAVLERAYVGHNIVIPAQVLAELFSVLVRKAKVPAQTARARVKGWQDKSFVAPTLNTTVGTAFDLACSHCLQTFDAVILAAAAEAGCRILISEDMQDGFTWGRVTVVNPFAATPHPLLADL